MRTWELLEDQPARDHVSKSRFAMRMAVPRSSLQTYMW